MINVHKLNLSQSLAPVMDRGRVLSDNKLIVGQHAIQLFNKLGKLKHEEIVPNGVVNEGKNSLLDGYFNSGTVYPTWYVGLINNTSFTQTLIGDTAASHLGWIEFNSYQSGSTDGLYSDRLLWGQGSASSGQVTNTSQMEFKFTTNNGNVRGIFVASARAKGVWTGVLWSTALLTASLPVSMDDILRISYTVSL